MSQIITNPTGNTELVRLKGLDLSNLLAELEKYSLEYRETLNLPQDVTFGIEIEYEKAIRKITNFFIKRKLPDWISKHDGSLIVGGEITSPIMTDTLEYWRELKKICNHLSIRGADTLHNAAGHIHIGTNILGTNIAAWKTFLKTYTAYEHIILRFLYGDKITPRKKLDTYACPVAEELYDKLDEINYAKTTGDISWVIHSGDRYVALNFLNTNLETQDIKKNTIEFRSPNATTNEIIWQNNINMLTKMLLSASQQVIDTEFLDYKLEKKPNSKQNGHIIIGDALEFADMVFDNNLDKVYFLRQYFKDLQDIYISNGAIMSKRFSRRTRK